MQLSENACNIIAVADSRAGTVNRGLQLLDKSRILQQLAARVPDTPHVLLLMAAEKTFELLSCGSKLEQAVAAIAQQGSAAKLRSCLQDAKLWLQQLATGQDLSLPAVREAASIHGTQGLEADQQLQLRLYDLLQSRKRHELEWLVKPAIQELRHRGWQGSEQSDLRATGVLTLVWWPKTFQAIKDTLQQQQAALGATVVEEACAVLADVTGVARLQQFVADSRLSWVDEQAAAAIDAHGATLQRVKDEVPLAAAKLQTDMLASLKRDAATESSAESLVVQGVLDRVRALKARGSDLGSGSLKALQQLVCSAVQDKLEPHLQKCSMERGLVSCS